MEKLSNLSICRQPIELHNDESPRSVGLKSMSDVIDNLANLQLESDNSDTDASRGRNGHPRISDVTIYKPCGRSRGYPRRDSSRLNPGEGEESDDDDNESATSGYDTATFVVIAAPKGAGEHQESKQATCATFPSVVSVLILQGK